MANLEFGNTTGQSLFNLGEADYLPEWRGCTLPQSDCEDFPKPGSMEQQLSKLVVMLHILVVLRLGVVRMGLLKWVFVNMGVVQIGDGIFR